MAKGMGAGGGAPSTGTPPFAGLGNVFDRGAPGSILPERGSQQQRDMVMAALQSGMGAAGQSGSPLLAFLAPMAGGAIGTRTEGLYNEAEAGRRSDAIDRLMAAMGGGGGGAMSTSGPAVRGAPGDARNGSRDLDNTDLPLAPGPRQPLSFSGVENANTRPATRRDAPLSFGSVELTGAGADTLAGNAGGDTLDARPSYSPQDREILARTLQAEAGGEGLEGMLAAGAVINNRVNADGYGSSYRDVIMAPGQFSAWNGVTGYAGGEGGLDMANMQTSGDAYRAADMLLSGQYDDPTGGATHYYNPSAADPDWGMRNGGNWRRIGNHVFGNADAGIGARAGGGGGIMSTSGSMGGSGGMRLNRDLLELMVDPNVPEQIRSVAASVFENQMQGADPMEALQLQKTRLEIADLMSPDPVKGINVGGSLVNPYDGNVLYEAPRDPSERRTYTAADGYRYYEDNGQRVFPNVQRSPESSSDLDRQVNVALGAINDRVGEMQNQINPQTQDFYTREEAIDATRNDPLYQRQWEMVERAQAGPAAGGGQATPEVPERPSGPTPGAGDMARPQSKDDYDALPSGTRFVAPDGTVRIKP